MEKLAKQRINEVLDHFNTNPNKLSEGDDALQRKLSRQIKGSTSISYDVLEFILQTFPSISPNWLMTGKGNMLKQEEAPVINYKKGRPYYDVDFICGFSEVINDQTTLPAYYIDYAPYNKDGVLWINVSGHSMEPEISSGDTIAIKEVDDWQKCIIEGEKYAIVTKNGLRTIKVVEKSDDGEHYILIPINKNGFKPQTIDISMVDRVYAVLGSMKKF